MLTAKQLYELWIEAHSNNSLSGYNPIQETGNYKARFMTPENIQKLLNSQDVFDLYTHPSSAPLQSFDYPSMAINQAPWSMISNKDKPTNYSFIVSNHPLRPLLNILYQKINDKEYSDIPKELHSLIPQAIYQHELEHASMQPFPITGNKGYITKNRLPGDIGIREAPAMKAEDVFWDNQLNRK